MKPYIDYSEAENPNANSYQAKRDRKSKNLISESKQGHSNRMKKSYKSNYHEKELMISPVTMPCPTSYIHGPDTLKVGKPGIFSARTDESFNSFDIQSAWHVSTPADMGFDKKIIDSIPPYTGKAVTPKKFAKGGDGERRWAETDQSVKRWADGGEQKTWADNNGGEKKWEGQQVAAESTGVEEGFCRAEYSFNKAGLVRMDTVPIIPGLDKLVKGMPKYVNVLAVSSLFDYSDDFFDNYVSTYKWRYRPSMQCFDIAETNHRIEFRHPSDPPDAQCFSDYRECEIISKCPPDYFLNSNSFEISVDFSMTIPNPWAA